MRTPYFLIPLALGALACPVGTSVGGFPPATGPAGITVVVRSDSVTVGGELLEAADTAMLVADNRAVWLIPYLVVSTARFEKRGSLNFGDRHGPDRAQLAEMRLLSRFPRGLAPELLQRLLPAYQQAEPAVVRR